MNLKQVLYSTVAVAGIAALSAAVLAPANAQPKPRTASITAAVAIDADDIGGVVKAPNGKPEAGVWVIAETTDLPTRFTRSVVTDDQGRYVIPDLPVANYQVWVRGYGLVNSPKMRAKPGQQLNHTSVPAPQRGRGRALLSGDLLVRDDEASAGEGLRRLERHSEEHHARHLASAHEQRRLHRLPSARSGIDAHHPGAVRQVRIECRGMAAPYPGRPVGRDDDQPHRRPARRRALQIFRRLDRPRRQGRAAEEQAGASHGPRAQSRRHHLGLVEARQVPARSDFVGPAETHGQCRRSALRRAGIFHRRDADP